MMRALAVLLAAAAIAATPVHAAEEIIDYSVTGLGAGTMSLAFDTGTHVYSLRELNLIFGAAAFDEAEAEMTCFFFIGGNQTGITGMLNSTDDFLIFDFQPGLSSQTVPAVYANRGTSSFWGSVTVNRSHSAVPEPTTWSLMLIGFGLAGGAIRSARRRRKLTVSYA